MIILVLLLKVYIELVSLASRALGKGKGTSISGIVVEKKIPWILKYFSNKYKKIILITGTNGKTTTRNLTTSIFKQAGYKTVSNLGGGNIYRGIATTFFKDLNFFLIPKSDIAIIEVEEATLPKLSKYLRADYLVLTNIFRDQLDVYAEIDKTLEFFDTSINNINLLNSNATIIANADDNKLLESIKDISTTIGFSLAESSIDFERSSNNTKLDNIYEATALSGLTNIAFNSSEVIDSIESSLEGEYNTYNILAAAAIADLNGVDSKHIKTTIKNQNPAFGRGEEFLVNDKKIKLFLVKNPVGFDETLKLISNSKDYSLGLAINDNTADGKDVSWLWDVDFERFVSNYSSRSKTSIYTSGSRGLDMLRRMQVAGLKVKTDNNIAIEDLVSKLLDSEARNIYICATYTAIFEIRKSLEQYTSVEDFDKS